MDLYDNCWLRKASGIPSFYISDNGILSRTTAAEAARFLNAVPAAREEAALIFELLPAADGAEGSFSIKENEKTVISASSERGLLYGFFELLRRKNCGFDLNCEQSPRNHIRMLDHWDNSDGSVERGYAGKSIFFEDGRIRVSESAGLRLVNYARLLASVGINAVCINNVNVRKLEAALITESSLESVKHIADIFRPYGIKLFLSVNFASPVVLGGAPSADPLNDKVREWWKTAAGSIFNIIPDFGGFVVKADSEGQPGPFAYGRGHADGANCIAEALAPYEALLIWRCFVYNCNQDWRDRKTDRARSAYDVFKPLDGKFLSNVALQIKNGPMDFQIREPVSPLLSAMPNTNIILEFQATQEYTGQQKHICYLAPMWKETLDFDTYANGPGSTVAEVMANKKFNGITAVSNIGSDYNWTGHKLAQANLYAFARLCWEPSHTADDILTEWIRQTFNLNREDEKILFDIMSDSRATYEKYTAPLGIGWMCKPNHHYGPDVDGYEYDRWGTYHFADRNGIGVDRTDKGSGMALTYSEPVASMYNNIETCPDELILFFHHVPYTHRLKSGKTVIQHIYDTHFEGYERVLEMYRQWELLAGKIGDKEYLSVVTMFEEQKNSAREWRDQINTYFYRKSGIKDEKGRQIYE